MQLTKRKAIRSSDFIVKGGGIRDELPPQAKAKFIANQGQMTPNKSLQVMAQFLVVTVLKWFLWDLVTCRQAAEHDVPPGILAGLLEQESGYAGSD